MLSYPLTPRTGHPTRIIEAGEPGQPLVFFVHGLAARADRWVRNLEVVAAAGFHAVAVDVPGHGFAARTEDVPVSVTGVVDELDAVLEALHAAGAAPSLSLVGSSVGGVYCAYLAERHASRTRSLHLSAPLGMEPLGERGRSGLASRLQDQSAEAVRRKIENLGLGNAAMVDRWVREELAANGSSAGMDYLSRLADELAANADDHLLTTILDGLRAKMAVYLYWGRRDAVVDVGIGERAAAERGLPIELFDASGHAPYLSEDEAFNAALLRDLSSALALRR